MRATSRFEKTLVVFILCGGKSSRMGRNKSELRLGGRTFLQRITAAALSLRAPVIRIAEDVIPGRGPLGGVATAFARHEFSKGLFLSCDMPLLSAEALDRFIRAAVGKRALFTSDAGRPGFPFFLRRTVKKALDKVLSGPERSLQALSREARAECWRPDASLRDQFLNVNTPADFTRARRAWAAWHDGKSVLEVRGLGVRRGGTRIVSEFSWKIRPGEHWVVLGPNGCGKTSVLNALLGYLTPTEGEIVLLGKEYGAADWPLLRKRIGLVSSSLRQMMPESEPAWITVASGKFAMIDFWGTPRPGDKSAALRILRKVGCEHAAERPWAVLSQGERQRVLIGRALMARPALLILDEPCAGLDPAAREHFLHFVNRLGRDKTGPALVLVTHHLEEIMPVFTHGLIMKAGRKIAEGPISGVLNSATLSAAFGTSVRVQKLGRRFTLRIRAKRGVIL